MDEINKQFYEDLQKVVENTPKGDTIIILGDLNARLGKEGSYRGVTGQYTPHQNTSGNGKLLCEFAVLNNMTIMSTQFQYKLIHKGTWISSDEKTVNQIDHVMINSSKKELTEDVRSMREQNIDSDHFLVRTTFNQKLCAVYKITKTLIKKWNKLNLQDLAKLKQYRKILHEKLSHINKK
jgi:endonuclease/exonuclease/phosphatase family metal-dependent hydrolase